MNTNEKELSSPEAAHPHERRGRRIAIAVLGTLFGLLSLVQFVMVVVSVLFMEPEADYRNHEVHDLGFAITAMTLGVGFLSQIRRPEDKIGSLRQLIVTLIALGTAMAIGGVADPIIVIAGIVTIALLALNPARDEVFRIRSPFTSALGTMAAAGAAALLYFGWTQLDRHLNLPASNAHSKVDHWALMIYVSLAIAFVALVAATKPRGWRVPAWTAGAGAILLGLGSIVFPTQPSSLGRIGGTLVVLAGLAFIAEAEWEHRTEASPPVGGAL